MYFSAFQAARINRKSFLLGNLGVIAVAIVGLAMMSGGNAWPFIGFVALAFNAVVSIYLTIGRLHDLNHSGWMTLILFVPFVGFLFSIYLLFAKGTSGTNNYACEPV